MDISATYSGGYALYYHNIRKPGEDLDLIVSEDD